MSTANELQQIELEALGSAFSACDTQVSFRFSDRSDKGTFCIFADLPGNGRVYLHAPPCRVPMSNDFVLEKLGDMWIYELKHLPPIQLKFHLPSDYPGSVTNPVFPKLALKSNWLPKTIMDDLTEQLDQLSQSNPGELVLWLLVEFLRTESHQFIFKYQTPSSTRSTHFDLLQFYAAHENEMPLSISQCTQLLLSNNDERLDGEFNRAMWECPVCLEVKLGSQFFRFRVCNHAVCLDCVRQAFILAVDSGLTTQQLGCLVCDIMVGVNEARFILPRDVFTRYETLLLNRGLNTMPDIAYCPRLSCQNMPVILDDADLGRCSNCGFAFCPKCLRPYHGADKCDALIPKDSNPAQDSNSAQDSNPTAQDSDHTEQDSNPTRQDSNPAKDCNPTTHKSKRSHKKTKVFEERPLTEEERAARERDNIASLEFADKHCKYCPGCWVPIQKNLGCNHMFCICCRTRFCWICLEPFRDESYDHTCILLEENGENSGDSS